MPLKPLLTERKPQKAHTFPSTQTVYSAISNTTILLTPVNSVQQAMVNADFALTFEQRSILENLFVKYVTLLSSGPEDMGRTNLIYHKIDIGQNEPVRQRTSSHPTRPDIGP